MSESSPTEAERLRKARALIADPDRWAQGNFAFDAEGTPVSSYSDNAVRWCAAGACSRVGADAGYLFRALPYTANNNLGVYNDNRAHRTILRLFDRAIELAELSR